VKLSDLLKIDVDPAIDRLKNHISEHLRPRLAELLVDTAMVQARKAGGQDTTTAEIALEASYANITRHERIMLEREASNLLIAVLMKIAGVISG
jgi:NAD-specific glutamate dehydrogenase